MKHLVWALMIGPISLFGQEKGIVFSENLMWQDILHKAKAEHKYVFVDCYATWCGPCKYMDKNVYTNDTVGGLMKDKFVCVKVQMDTTKQDGAGVQNWYTAAHSFAEQYHVQAYPTYLFFSPEGRVVHQDVGALNIKAFLALASAATDSQKQYYTLLERYRHDDKQYELLPYMAKIARKLGDDSQFVMIAKDYLQHLERVSPEQLWTKENISFIVRCWEFVSSNDLVFKWYYRDKKAIDSVMGKADYADGLINTVAYREEIQRYVDEGIKNGKEPNWRRIERRIEKGFGKDYVAGNVAKGRLTYYKATKEWASYAKCFFRWACDQGIETWQPVGMNVYNWNDYAYEIFKYSQDRKELEAALSWAERALTMASKPNAQTMDTKANILYKLGRKDEGLVLEAQSSILAPQDKEIQENYEKMKKGQPTWIQ